VANAPLTAAKAVKGAEGPSTPVKATPVKATPVRTVEGISEFTLPNGLRFLIVPDGTQSTVTVNITYLVGSLYEGYGETGMAHLLEHMAFKGSPQHRNVLALVDARGGHGNGSTWNDRTNYFETLPATTDALAKENLEWALNLEADRMVNCSILAEDLATEFSVVRNEFEMGENDPVGVLRERIVASAYLWHNYGKDTIGSRTDIEKVPVDALRVFYKKYYQPDNAMVVVSGKVDSSTAVSSVEKIFGGIPKPTRVLRAPYSVEPVQDGERFVTLRRNGDLPLVGTTYHTVAGASPDYTATSAVLSILTRKPSGRLYKALVETKLAAKVSGEDLQFRDPGLATFIAEVRDPKNVAKVKETMVSVVEGLWAAKLEESELERWRNAELKDFDMLFSDSERVAVLLSEYAALGDWRTIFTYREQVKKTTLADVQRVAKAYFKSSNRTMGEFIPSKETDRAPFTEAPTIDKIVAGIEGGAGTTQGENFTATLDTLEGRTQRKQLKGGLSAAFLPKQNRGGRVRLQLNLHFGDETSLAGKWATARIGARMLARGTAKRTYLDLRDAQDKVRSTITFRLDRADTIVAEIESFRDQLPAAIDFMAEMLTTSTFPEKELEVVRAEGLAEFQEALSDPQQLAFAVVEQMRAPWPKGHPNYRMTPAEKLEVYKKVTANDLKAFHKDFLGASHAEVAVVGDCDPTAVASKLEAALGSWAAKKPYARVADKAFDLPGTNKQIDTKDKEMAQIAIGLTVPVKDNDPDYPALAIMNQIVGGDLGSRIWMRVREKEGLSYGAGTWFSPDSFDPASALGSYAIVAPQNADRAQASLLDELGKASTTPVTQEELGRAKGVWLKKLDTDLSNDAAVVSMLVGDLETKRTFVWTKELRTKIEAVTAEDVSRVAKKYLRSDRLMVVKAGDFTKK
jgi:zinc protease